MIVRLMQAIGALLGAALVGFVLLAVRSVREEANLEARFGDAYREYRRRTGRFLPRLRALRTGPAG